MFKYPFNKYGYNDYVWYPVHYFFWKLKAFHKIDFAPWDCCDLHETVFAQFEFFCKHNPYYFINQVANEHNGIMYELKHNPELKEHLYNYDHKIEVLKRLNEIQEYVLHTRKLNRAKLDYLRDLESKSSLCYFTTMESNQDYSKMKIESYFYVHYDFVNVENGELIYDIRTSLEKPKDLSSIYDIEEMLSKLDRKYAQEIIALEGYIWN